jgi:hypothetical protein
MRFQLYTQVVLLGDVPEENLKKGDIGTVVEEIQNPSGNSALILEFFDANGQTVSVSIIDEKLLGPLPEHSILQVREFKAA